MPDARYALFCSRRRPPSASRLLLLVNLPIKNTDMTEIPAIIVDDLEDGEIESDEEGAVTQDQKNNQETDPAPVTKAEPEIYQPKEGKKKKNKNKDKGNKVKDKGKKHKFPSPIEDDFAGNIEKAIRKALKNDEDDEEVKEQQQPEEKEDTESRRKNKKRKKHDGNSTKKRRKRNTSDDAYDDEMMFVRGASPTHKAGSPYDNYHSDGHDSYGSDSSYDDPRNHHPLPQRNRPPQRDRKNKNNRDRRRDNIHPMQDPDGVCLYYMQGKCHKGDDCVFSHDAEPPRKMELCKFYLMDCCAKRDKCLYLHGDFPCKYYHTGLPCIFKDDCKFSHGKPLTDNLKAILLKHIESAPKEILGDFPRLSREGATMMIHNTQMRLMQQYSPGSIDANDKSIPSIFESNTRRPKEDKHNINNQFPNKNSSKIRHSRWQQENSMPNLVANAPTLNPLATPDVLNIKNLTGVLTAQQISDLTKLGIENLNQLSQLTVIQLNHLGLTLKQINDIQLNTMTIQKLGLINSNEVQGSAPNFPEAMTGSKDLDMRIAPAAPVVNAVVASGDVLGKDVDMRFQPSISIVDSKKTNDSQESERKPDNDLRVNKDTIDIDQYTKDALKFASKEKENIDNMSTDTFDEKIMRQDIDTPKAKDVDHRVLKYINDVPSIANVDDFSSKSEGDTDIRFLHPDNYSKKPEKRHRRSTTDDEDNNLLIDEKWYSSDEEKLSKNKSPKQSPRPTTPQPMPSVIEPSIVLNKLGDLSKIDISDEVTKLLTTMKNNLQENKEIQSSLAPEQSKPRDPRSLPKKSPEHKSSSVDLIKASPQRRFSKISIYECVEGEPTDGRKRTDVDLRQLDQDFRLPAFGDTDLRQTSSSGDIDFRLGLPFKPLPNYTPATEIEGSFNSHPLITYKVKTIDIPRPDYTDIKNSTAKSQALTDPRLRKLFRLSIEEPTSDSEKSIKLPSTPRADPRRKPKESTENMEHKSSSLDLQIVIQNSTWYKELSTNQKIFVNQQLATVTTLIKKFQQDLMPGKRFDLSQILTNPVLCSIFNNLGVSLDENAEFSYLNKSQDNLLKTSMNYNQNSDVFNSNINPLLESGNLSMMNVPALSMGNMGGMPNMNMNPFNAPFPNTDPRNAPGILGIAPNMPPHSFDNPNFGPPNFGQDGFPGNMSYNGSGNDFGGMDSDQGYHRNQGRGNYRGGGNERWNRGGGNYHGGNRDRRNFNDRGGSAGWNNDRN